MNPWLDAYLRHRTGRSYHDITFAFDVFSDRWLGFALLAIAALISFLFVWHTLIGASSRRRLLLASMRAALVALLLGLVLGPHFIGRRIDPATSVALILFDDSQSMGAANAAGGSAGQRLLDRYAAGEGRFERQLTGSHSIRAFEFGERLTPVAGPSALRFDQRQSDIVGSIRAAALAAGREQVAAIILFSDGAHVGPGPRTRADLDRLEGLPPVFAVGVGTTVASSLALESIAVSRTHFDHSPVALTAHVTAAGLAGHRAAVEVFEGQRLVARTPFTLSRGGIGRRIGSSSSRAQRGSSPAASWLASFRRTARAPCGTTI